MFESKWALLVRMTLDARGVCACSQPRLLELKTTVRIVAIAALHRAFQNLVMERKIKLVLCFAMTTQAKLRLARFEQLDRGNSWLLCVCRRNESD